MPVPDGWSAALSLYPAHPLSRTGDEPASFDVDRYEAFQQIMRRYGDAELLAGKQAAFASAPAAAPDDDGDTRRQALGLRIGQRQSKWLQAQGVRKSTVAES